MGRRKRKQVVYRPVKMLPKVFKCPQCGKKTMRTKKDKGKNQATVICGSCGKEQIVEDKEIYESVDHFGEFIDIYYAEQEYDRLTKRAARLENKQQYSELGFVYSYLSDICMKNSEEAGKEYEKTKNSEDLDNAQMWKAQGEEYRKLSKEIFEKLELKELEDGIDDGVYEDDESQQFAMPDSKTVGTSKKAKKGRDIEDILDDPGFLEF